jgi:hypothetical protein
MSFTRLLQKLEQIQKQIQRLSKEGEESISEIDIDLLKELTRSFYAELLEIEISTKSTENKVDIVNHSSEPVVKIVNQSPENVVEIQILKDVIVTDQFQVATTTEEENGSQEDSTAIQDKKWMPEEIEYTVKVNESDTDKLLSESEPVISKLEQPEMRTEEMRDEESDLLFSFPVATDLASKLSEKKVDDLLKALSLNDKLNFKNNLFAADSAQFSTALERLNRCAHFEEAKQIIWNDYAKPLDWTSKTKLNLAKEFVKWVKRRYI